MLKSVVQSGAASARNLRHVLRTRLVIYTFVAAARSKSTVNLETYLCQTIEPLFENISTSKAERISAFGQAFGVLEGSLESVSWKVVPNVSRV